MNTPAFELEIKALFAWAEERLEETLQPQPLSGDAGARRYFRLAKKGMLLMFGPDANENAAWWHIGSHLKNKGLPLPQIYHANLAKGFFILEDFGDELLVLPQNQSFFPKAIEILARLHLKGAENFQNWNSAPTYDAAFVESAEINYFLREMGKFLNLGKPALALADEVRHLAQMATEDQNFNVLMHRDFQGRNLVAWGSEKCNQVSILDWQGARIGPAAYDLASLLHETPYAPLPPQTKEELIGQYCRLTGFGGNFLKTFPPVAAVRMMQALGAYAKLSSNGKIKYRAFIAPALEILENLFTMNLKDLPILKSLVTESRQKISCL